MLAIMAPLPDSFVPQHNISSHLDLGYSLFQSDSLHLILIGNINFESLTMSASLLDWPLAPAKGLPLSSEDCLLLLDSDILELGGDLWKSFPYGSGRIEAATAPAEEYVGAEDAAGAGSLYPASPSPPSPPESKPQASLACAPLPPFPADTDTDTDTDCKQGLTIELGTHLDLTSFVAGVNNQENIFPIWLEEKVDLPIYEPAGIVEPAALVYGGGAYSTEALLREFENVYGAVEQTHLAPSQLTPPQSPPAPAPLPLPATQLLLTYAQQAAQPAAAPWPADLEQELAVVEEMVRQRAAHLPGTPSHSPRSSPPSSPFSSSAHSSADEDWHAPSHRAKPYAYGAGDDRRSRKKEQNKNAATRYRQKKKAEVEVLLNEENRQRQLHNDLDTKCTDLQREIRYLKGLMRDLFKAKGLIK